MYAKLLVLVVFLFILPIGYTLQITKIMYNPSGSDAGREWIEIYSDSAVNLSGWKLVTDRNHVLNEPPENGGIGSLFIESGSYAVIAQDAFAFLKDYPTYNGILIDSSWTALTNSEPKIVGLMNGNATISATYSIVNEGSSWCPSGECTPSPGMPNEVQDPVLPQNPYSQNISINTSITAEDIVSYPKEVYIGDIFEINVSVSGHNEVYSYVYKDRTPVSLGFNGVKWLGSWDANKVDVSGLSYVVLKNIIENGTKPGNYTLRVKVDGNDISKFIEVFEKPFLKINKTKNSALVYTNCDSCRILVIGSGETATKNYTLNESGNYNIVLMKDQSIISSEKVVIAKPAVKKQISGKLSLLIVILHKLRLF